MFFKTKEEVNCYFRNIEIDVKNFEFDKKILDYIKKITNELVFENESSFLYSFVKLISSKPFNEQFVIIILDRIYQYDNLLYSNLCEYFRLVCVIPNLKTNKLYHTDLLTYCLNEKYLKLSKKIIELGIFDPNYLIEENENNKKNLLDNQNKKKKNIEDDDDYIDHMIQNLTLLGHTPLLTACLFDSEEIVDLLLSKGARTDICDPYGLSPLILACAKNNFNLAEKILNTGNAIPDKLDKNNKSAFFYAIHYHNEDFALKLLKNHNINPKNYPGYSTAFLDCCKKKLNNLCYELLKLSDVVERDYINFIDDNDNTALEYCIIKKNIPLCIQIINTGLIVTDYQMKDNKKTTLILAIENNLQDIALLIMNNRVTNGLYCSYKERSKYCTCEECQKIFELKNIDSSLIEIIDVGLNMEFVYACKYNMYELANFILNLENRRIVSEFDKMKDFAIDYVYQNKWENIFDKLLKEPSHFQTLFKTESLKKSTFEIIFENNQFDYFDKIYTEFIDKYNKYLFIDFDKKNISVKNMNGEMLKLNEFDFTLIDFLKSGEFKQILTNLKKICMKNKFKHLRFYDKIENIYSKILSLENKQKNILDSSNSLTSNMIESTSTDLTEVKNDDTGNNTIIVSKKSKKKKKRSLLKKNQNNHENHNNNDEKDNDNEAEEHFDNKETSNSEQKDIVVVPEPEPEFIVPEPEIIVNNNEEEQKENIIFKNEDSHFTRVEDSNSNQIDEKNQIIEDKIEIIIPYTMKYNFENHIPFKNRTNNIKIPFVTNKIFNSLNNIFLKKDDEIKNRYGYLNYQNNLNYWERRQNDNYHTFVDILHFNISKYIK